MPYLVCLLLLLGLCHVMVPRITFAAQRQRAVAACRRERVIALTFDDGPGTALTPAILDRLAAARAPATFFALGRNVPGREAILRRIVAEGHQLGCHGQDHVHYVFQWPGRGLLDLHRAWRTLAPLVRGPVTALPFRPPFGKLTLPQWLYLRLRGTPVVTWTQDAMDTRPDLADSPADLAGRIRAQGGGVVLLHDFDRDERRIHADVLARLDAILALQRQGFRFVGLDELHRPAPATAPGLQPEA